jgi:26S proteasome regulatory subunit N10
MQSSVGLGLMGGRQVEVLCTMTSDSVKANSFLFGCKVHGELHFTQALQVGSLALKHRSNETQKQRMVCFIGSTVAEDLETLKILGKKLKKNNIAVDLVCFGDVSQ